MKKILFLFLLLPIFLNAQTIASRTNALTLAGERYVTNSPLNTVGNSYTVESIQDSVLHQILSKAYLIRCLNSTVNDGAPNGVLWTDAIGLTKRSPLSQLSLPYSQITGTPSIPAQYNPSAGTGISITGSYPNQTITNTAVNPTPSFNNSPSLTIQTVAASGNGNQLSSTRMSFMNYSVTINTTISLSGNATGYVALEICATNSSTAGDWVEIGRVPSGQTGTLVIGLTLNQVGGGQVSGLLPAGWFRRIRSVNTAGNPLYTYNSGQEILY